MKTVKILYWSTTGLLTALMLISAGMYFFNYEEVKTTFTALGYPAYIIYPLAILKILGLVAIWTKKSKALKEWAYAGFLFDFVLAAAAHIAISDGQAGGAFVAIILLITSYATEKTLFFSKKTN